MIGAMESILGRRPGSLLMSLFGILRRLTGFSACWVEHRAATYLATGAISRSMDAQSRAWRYGRALRGMVGERLAIGE